MPAERNGMRAMPNMEKFRKGQGMGPKWVEPFIDDPRPHNNTTLGVLSIPS